MNIRLVPNTGIQYCDLEPIDPKTAGKFEFGARIGDRPDSIRPPQRGVEDDAEPEDSSRLSSRQGSPRLIIELVKYTAETGLWLPLPFDVGGLWVAAYLRLDDDGKVKAVLAVDTTLMGCGSSEGPGREELGLRCPSPWTRIFWRRPAVEAWLGRLVDQAKEAQREGSIDDFDSQEMWLSIAALAQYLRDTRKLSVSLASIPEPTSQVRIDLTVDLGNNRTAAILKETGADRRQAKLECRYPEDPREVYPCPFETQLAFIDHRVVPREVPSRGSFRFLSNVQMGPRAAARIRSSLEDTRRFGLCSPKRYIWDSYENVSWPWSFANLRDNHGVAVPIDSDILRRMSTQRPLEEPAIPEPPIEPNYPRISATIWAMVEILEQAFRQANTPEFRRAVQQAPRCDSRRVIANVAVIYPAGMHADELRAFRAACSRAAKLWAEFRTSPEQFCTGSEVSRDPEHGVDPPNIQMVCDEGLAIQVCWLYSEAVHRHQGRADRLVEHLGRNRGGRPSIRLASLDIGGGTTDLAIADFEIDPAVQAGIGMRGRRLFHDGISVAGDDVVRSILELVVFPAVIEQTGISPGTWNAVFATAESDQEADRILRQRLVRNVWIPIALECLGRGESPDFQSYSFTIGKVARAPELLKTLHERLAGSSGTLKVQDLHEVHISFDRNRLRTVVRQAIGRTIDQCGDIIDQYECDLLIVGGRPSSNTAIREEIYSSMAVPPAQVVFLSELQVAEWYPFSGGGAGTIHDAKTCGVVGGSLAFEALYGQQNFRLLLEPTAEPDPIFGYVVNVTASGSLQIEDEHRINLEDDLQEISFLPLGPRGLTIASRRVAHRFADAKPVYRLRMKRKYADALSAIPVGMQPLRVRFGRGSLPAEEGRPHAGDHLGIADRGGRSVVKVASIEGQIPFPQANGEVRYIPGRDAMEPLRLRTMIEEAYWIDTGVFSPHIDHGDA